MDFELNETQDAYVAMARQFAAKALAPRPRSGMPRGAFPRTCFRRRAAWASWRSTRPKALGAWAFLA